MSRDMRQNAFRYVAVFLTLLVPGWQSGNAPASRSIVFRSGLVSRWVFDPQGFKSSPRRQNSNTSASDWISTTFKRE